MDVLRCRCGVDSERLRCESLERLLRLSDDVEGLIAGLERELEVLRDNPLGLLNSRLESLRLGDWLEGALWLDYGVLVLQKTDVLVPISRRCSRSGLWCGGLTPECGERCERDRPSKLAVKRSKVIVPELGDSTHT